MYQIGDYIVYGNEGVCRVDEIAPFHIPGMTAERLYYTLTPLYHDEKIYTPVGYGGIHAPGDFQGRGHRADCHDSRH